MSLRVTTLLAEQVLGFAVVVLPKNDSTLLGTVYYPLSRTIIQPSVGRETNFLFLHRRVYIHSFELMWFYCFCLQSGVDRLLQQLSGTGISDALSPAHHTGRINGSFMLEELHSAEGLPVWILHPALNDVFVAEVVGVLQIVKSNHQSRTDSGSPGVGTIGRSEKLIEPIPVDDMGQFDQPMARVDDAAELNPEQIVLPIVVGRFLWFHALKNCKLLGG